MKTYAGRHDDTRRKKRKSVFDDLWMDESVEESSADSIDVGFDYSSETFNHYEMQNATGPHLICEDALADDHIKKIDAK